MACLSLLALPLRAQEKTLDELLNLDLSDLLNLKVVSALKSPETINKTPATVRVISAEDIRENGYFTLEEALADLPGIQFRNIEGFNSYVFMRGVPGQNNKILVLVDGVLINELNSGGFYGGMQYDLADVERIEVVYGPASALYGTNAVSGVINIITRDPRETPGGHVSAGLGNFGTRLADARYGYYDKKSDVGFNVAAMVIQSDKADLKGEAGDNNWTQALENFEKDVSVQARACVENFSAGFLFQDKNASYATTQVSTGGPVPLSDHGVNWHIRFINVWAGYVYEKQKTWSFRTTAYYRDATVPEDTIPVIELATEESAGRQYRWYRPNHLIGDETQLRWNPGPRWRFSFGLILERESLAEKFAITESDSATTEPASAPEPKMMNNSLFSVYAQAQVTLTRPLELFLGLRHDDSSYYGKVNTPQLGLVLNEGKLTAKALYMQAFRAPKPWDYTIGLGNPDLKPEKSNSYELSGGWSFSGNLRFDLAVYHNRLSNLLTRVIIGTDNRWINAGTLNVTGGEAGLEYRKGRLKAWANYTYTSSLEDGDKQVAEIAPHGCNLGLQYAFTSDLRLSLRGQYLGERKNPKIIPSTGTDVIAEAFVVYAAFSADVLKGFDVRLVVDNLFDAVYYHPSNLPPSRYRQPQRSFRISAGYSF